MRRFNAGFTLIELMITIAVLAILGSLALPAMQNVIKNNRISAQTNTLITAFQFARSEAIRKNGIIRICAGAVEDGDSGVLSNNPCSGSWHDGWIVYDPDGFSDTDGNTTLVASRSWAALSGGSIVSSPENEIKFLGSGMVSPDDVSGANTTLTIKASDCEAKQRRDIVITRSGNVYSSGPKDCD